MYSSYPKMPLVSYFSPPWAVNFAKKSKKGQFWFAIIFAPPTTTSSCLLSRKVVRQVGGKWYGADYLLETSAAKWTISSSRLFHA